LFLRVLNAANAVEGYSGGRTDQAVVANPALVRAQLPHVELKRVEDLLVVHNVEFGADPVASAIV
jgi:hypothetical protein